MRPSLTAVLLALVACGGDGPPPETEGEGLLSAMVADTQFVIDSSGARLMIVVNRRPGGVQEIHPRKGAGDPDAPDAYRVLEPPIVRSMMQGARPPWRVIDVRKPEEYVREGHLEGALLIELERLEENIGDLHVRTDQIVVVYGKDTGSAVQAARLLAEYGYPNVRVLEEGFAAWRAAGLPVESAP